MLRLVIEQKLVGGQESPKQGTIALFHILLRFQEGYGCSQFTVARRPGEHTLKDFVDM